MKKIITILLLMNLMLVTSLFGQNDQQTVWLKSATSSGTVFNVYATTAESQVDSTKNFNARSYMSFFAKTSGSSDSVSFRIIAKSANRDSSFGASTQASYTTAIDTATTAVAGNSFLIWNNSSSRFLVAPSANELYLTIETVTGNAYRSTLELLSVGKPNWNSYDD